MNSDSDQFCSPSSSLNFHLGEHEIFSNIKSYCLSAAAQDSIDQFKPLSPTKATQRCLEILAYKKAIEKESFKIELNGIDAAQIWLRKVKKNQSLSISDLKDIRTLLYDIEYIQQKFSQIHSKELLQKKPKFSDPQDMLSYINHVISPSGEINIDASKTLYDFFQEKKSLSTQVQKLLNQIVKNQNLEKILQDRFVTTREGRLVLPIISGMRHDFEGIIHDFSQSKQTVFMEPTQAISSNNKISELEIKIQKEIEKILRELSQYIHSEYNHLEKNLSQLIHVDTFYALGYFASLTHLQSFHWSESPKISLLDLKHPLLQMELQEKVVSNTVELDTNQSVLILSGPNAGGKTVLLKSIGLACLMASYGLPICADPQSKMSPFKNIFVSLGDEQNLEENLSSFGGHLKKLNAATQLKGPDQLILIDEICGTTEAQEGSALARAFIEEFQIQKVFAVITSHLAPLKTHWKQGVINGSMQYDLQNQSPNYTFIMGFAGESLALQTARRYGVNEGLLKRALEHLTPESQRRFSGLEEIQKIKQKLIDLQRDYQDKKSELLKREHKIFQREKEFEKLKDKGLDKELLKYQKTIEEFIKFEKLKSSFENQKKLKEIKEKLPQIVKFSSSHLDDSFSSASQFESQCPPGTSVTIRGLNKKGIVQGKLNTRGEVPVLSNSMRISVHFSKLLPSPGSSSTTSKVFFKKTSPSKTSHPMNNISEKTLDVRGQTVTEALDILEAQLDQTLQHKISKLKIIHGHGESDRLKKSIRTFLSRNTFVKSWFSGQAYNESDGVTIVEVLL